MRLFSNKKEGDEVEAVTEGPGRNIEKEVTSSSPEHTENRAKEGENEVEPIDPELEKRVRRKLDTHVVPLVAALYLLSFLDRSNIG